jgi:hypothetical protein
MNLGVRFCRLAMPLVFAIVAGTSAASAATFKYSSYNNQIYGGLNGQYVTIKTPRSVTGVAGQVQLIGSGPNAGQNLLVYCLDIYSNLQHSGTYTISQLTTAGAGGSNPTLTNTQIGEIGSLIVHGNALIAQATASTVQAISAAIQLAIWNIEYNNPKKVNGQSVNTQNIFTYTGIPQGTINLANTYVANVEAGGSWDSLYYNVTLLKAYGDQSMVYVNQTPLPAALPLFATGLGIVGLLARRRKRKAALAMLVK